MGEKSIKPANLDDLIKAARSVYLNIHVSTQKATHNKGHKQRAVGM